MSSNSGRTTIYFDGGRNVVVAVSADEVEMKFLEKPDQPVKFVTTNGGKIFVNPRRVDYFGEES